MSEERRLGTREQASEALLMGLRLTEGIDLADLSRRFSIPREQLVNPEKLALYGTLGLVAREGDHLAVTDAGMPLLDALLGELVPEELVAQ